MDTLKKIPIVLFTAIVISGCQVDVTADLYSEDLLTTDANTRFPATLEIEIPSCSSTDRESTELEILSIFSSQANAEISGCREEGFKSLLAVRFEGEIASEESNFDLVVFRNRNADGNRYFTAALTQGFRTRMNTLLDNNMQKLDHSDLTLTVNLRHDLDQAADYFLTAGWVNEDPGQYLSGEIAKRDIVQLRFSNLISDMVLRNDQPILFFLNSADN